ncbi:Cdk-activating kinase assembly factor [Heracleum sosnowskyi]|uniref:Cdk-activating kinase assembly factor n=1 Tax=Heracleum sosnowskyi TaxID=360622 RepID=A0AAD8GWK6_9APIA|nr:Cdk-activating kinase assembly factor [Heracleum sosnowskyi]
MSAQEVRNPITYVRQSRRRKMIEVDSNASHSHEGSMAQIIDVEAYDDDVMLSSPREFAEAKAKNCSRRKHRRTILIDLESEGQSTGVSTYNLLKRRRALFNQIVQGSSKPVNENARSMKVDLPLPRPPPVEPTFTCPVCMGPYVEEMSTKCGHIFCKKCIRASIAVRGQCPTCRGKISMKNTIRVFLPAAN